MAKHGFYMALQKKKQLKSIRRGGKQKGQVANMLHTKKKTLRDEHSKLFKPAHRDCTG